MKLFNHIMIVLAVLFAFQSCEIDTVDNPNAPTAESLLNGATLADLRLLSHGVESVMRNDMQFHYWTTSIVGREYYDLNGTDPRYTGELLGAQGAVLDNNGFLTTRGWNAAYRTARNSINLEIATDNTSATLTSQEVSGIKGYAKTVRAYALLLELGRQYQNGIKLDIEDPDKTDVPLVGYTEALSSLASMLDEGLTQLNAAGGSFIFDLSSGFTGYNTPDKFAEFNRAVRARVALYQGDMNAARTALTQSYFDIAGDMNLGVYHSFGTGGNDIRNPLFNVPNTDLYTVHPTWLADAEAGDTRIDAKTTPLDSAEIDLPVMLDGLSGTVQVTLYASDITNAGIIRNEELVLIYAEANVGTSTSEAVAAINAVRSAAGLADYSGATDDASLIDEILHQRRYSLFGEGHRWIDLRRFNRLDEVPLDRAGDVVHTQFPTPVLEIN